MNSDRATDFQRPVTEVLDRLKPGEVVTYGEVAEEAGYPGRARAVGQLLAASTGYPWWRVVTSTGRLVPGNEARHRQLLAAEGVPVRGNRVVMSR